MLHDMPAFYGLMLKEAVNLRMADGVDRKSRVFSLLHSVLPECEFGHRRRIESLSSFACLLFVHFVSLYLLFGLYIQYVASMQTSM